MYKVNVFLKTSKLRAFVRRAAVFLKFVQSRCLFARGGLFLTCNIYVQQVLRRCATVLRKNNPENIKRWCCTRARTPYLFNQVLWPAPSSLFMRFSMVNRLEFLFLRNVNAASAVEGAAVGVTLHAPPIRS